MTIVTGKEQKKAKCWQRTQKSETKEHCGNDEYSPDNLEIATENETLNTTSSIQQEQGGGCIYSSTNGRHMCCSTVASRSNHDYDNAVSGVIVQGNGFIPMILGYWMKMNKSWKYSCYCCCTQQ